MATKEKRKQFTSPVGVAQYPRLFVPDTKFEADGVYSVKLTYENSNVPGVQDMLDQFETVIEEAGKLMRADEKIVTALKKKGKKPEEADRGFNIDPETGMVSVNFKMRASGTTKDGKAWSRKPAVFDKFGKPLSVDTKLGGGSEIKVAYSVSPWYTALGYGCSVRLEAAQVTKVVEWQGGTADSYGFSVETPEAEDTFPAVAAEGTPNDASTDF